MGKQKVKKDSASEDQNRVFFVLVRLLVSSPVPGWETICSQAGKKFLAAETWWQRFSSLQPHRHKAQPPLPQIQYLWISSVSQPNHSSFCLLFGFFFQLETHHILGKKNNQKTTVSIVSKTCLLSARSVYRAPVSSQPSLQTEKPETLWEVIFQSTKTGALEISANDKMNHCSPKQRLRFELMALRSCVG